MTGPRPPSLTVAIPTYRRNRVLIETLGYLLDLRPAPTEILVLDQTENHDGESQERLSELDARGSIRWVRLSEPSIPKAMNRGLLLAKGEAVLFLDDDIRPERDLLTKHLEAQARGGEIIVAGRVVQPWQEGKDYSYDTHFHFASTRSAWIGEFMGGNFSVPRQKALAIGGFDENFVRVAYRFEAEFAYRFRAAGGRIYYEPAACIHHLKEASGGTRTYDDYMTTSRPDHTVGAYYYCLRTREIAGLLIRPFGAVATRFHLRNPWRIPATLLAEARGMLWAWQLHRSGPNYVTVFPKGEEGA